MALIRCPECKRKISDMAVSCPHCGFVLSAKNISKNVKDENMSASHKYNFGSVLMSIIRFEWVDDIADILFDIPFIGGFLGGLFTIMAVIIILAIIIVIGGLLFWGLLLIHPALAIAVGAIGMNVISYCASYVWGARKPCFFWVGFILTILCLIVFLSYWW